MRCIFFLSNSMNWIQILTQKLPIDDLRLEVVESLHISILVLWRSIALTSMELSV